MENFSGPIWLVGGSVRAAAASALRAGWQPTCTDFFADADLRRLARVEPVDHYPTGLVHLAERMTPSAWLYTGGLESHPEIVAAISRRHKLWGNHAEVVKRARDPYFLAEILNRAGLPSLPVCPAAPDDYDRWLLKPLSGSGGCGIKEWQSKNDVMPLPPRLPATEVNAGIYFQRFATGESISALFLAYPGDARLLGITSQLVGLPEVDAPRFRWCGNITPFPISPAAGELIARIGRTISESCSLRGLFGCDFILADNVPWLTEVNPRYTGSVELVEYLQHVPLLEWHRRACQLAERGDHSTGTGHGMIQEFDDSRHRNPTRFVGKLILYTAEDGIAADATRFVLPYADCQTLPFVADIPVPNSSLQAGQPLCTVYATAGSHTECRKKLVRRARLIRRRMLLSPG